MSSITLSQANYLSQDMLVAGVIDEIATTDLFFKVLPFVGITGDAMVYNRELTLGGADFIAVGGTVSKTPSTVTKITVALTRIVGDAEIDTFIQKAMSETNDQAAIQVAQKSKRIGRLFQYNLINGTGSSNSFTGLKSLVTAAQTVSSGADGCAISFSLLDQALDAVKIDGKRYILANSRTVRAIRALVRASGGTTATEVVIPEFGQPLLTYNGIPILRNDWIGIAETKGTGTALARVYVVVPDEAEGLHAIYPKGTPAGIEVDNPFPHQDKDEIIYRIRMITGIVLRSTLAVSQIKGITN